MEMLEKPSENTGRPETITQETSSTEKEINRSPEQVMEKSMQNELAFVAPVMSTRLSIAEARQAAPERVEEVENLQARLQEIISKASETLRQLGASAAFGAMLTATSPAEALENKVPSTETLMENPAMTTQLLEGAVVTAPQLSLATETKHEVENVLKEIRSSKHVVSELGRTLAIRAGIVLLEVSGFSFVGHVCDTIKDVARVFNESRKNVIG